MTGGLRIFDLFTKADYSRAREDKLVNVRFSSQDSGGEGLAIYNYTDAALYTLGAWDNPAVRVCRGLIVDDATGRIVARAWDKFFNYGQAEHLSTAPLGEPVEV